MAKSSSSILKNISWLFTSNLSSALVRIILTAILARILLPSDFGLISMALIVLGFVEIFSNSAVTPSLIREEFLNKTTINTAFSLSLIFSLLVYLLLYFSIPLIVSFFNTDRLEVILEWIIISAPIKTLQQVPFAILSKDSNFKRISIINFLSFFCYGVVGILLALLGYGVFALVVANIFQSVFKTTFLFASIRGKNIRLGWSLAELKNILGFGSKITLGSLCNYFSIRVDNIFIGKYLGEQALGFYSKSYGIMEIFTTVLGKVYNLIFLTEFSNNQRDSKKVNATFTNSLSIVFTFFLPLTIIVFFCAPDIVLILLGNGWEKSVVALKILSLGIVFRMLMKVEFTAIQALGYGNLFLIIQVLYFMLTFTVCFLLIEKGIESIAFGVTLAVGFLFVINLFLLKNKMKFNIRTIGKELGYTVVINSLFVWVIATIFPLFEDVGFIHSLMRLFLSFFTYILLFLLGVVFSPTYFNQKILLFCKKITHKLINKSK